MKLETIVVQIGNSDNKLPQHKWSEFIKDTRVLVGKHCGEVHFDGGSGFDSRWQNMCIVAEIYGIDKPPFMNELYQLKVKYFQDSIAVICGETVML